MNLHPHGDALKRRGSAGAQYRGIDALTGNIRHSSAIVQPRMGAMRVDQGRSKDTFGNLLNFNPHLHVIAAEGGFTPDGGPTGYSCAQSSSI